IKLPQCGSGRSRTVLPSVLRSSGPWWRESIADACPSPSAVAADCLIRRARFRVFPTVADAPGRLGGSGTEHRETSRGAQVEAVRPTERIDMSHAVVMQVKLPRGDDQAEERMLKEQVIPHARTQAGFQKGMWMRSDDETGMGVVVFDNEDNAQAAMAALKPPAGGPVLISSKVFQIGAEA